MSPKQVRAGTATVNSSVILSSLTGGPTAVPPKMALDDFDGPLRQRFLGALSPVFGDRAFNLFIAGRQVCLTGNPPCYFPCAPAGLAIVLM